MNPVIKEALKEDVRYTASLILYMFVIIAVFGLLLDGGGSAGDANGDFYFTYVSIFGTFLVSAYCCSKAKMDRYFCLGFSRRTFRKQCLALCLVRSLLMAAFFGVLGAAGRMLSAFGGAAKMAGNIFRLPDNMEPGVYLLLLFLYAWTVSSCMLMDATRKKPRFSAAVYLTSPKLWSFNNNKMSKKRSGNRVMYILLVVVFVGAAYVVLMLLDLFFRWWMAGAVAGVLVAINIVFLSVFSRNLKRIDIL